MRAWFLGLCALAFSAPLVVDSAAPEIFPAWPEGWRNEAAATTSVTLTLEELVELSRTVAVVEPVERSSRWEEVGSSKRIVTYTKLVVHDVVTGEKTDEVWVRTLGGKVGKVGQHVAGEAQFTIGERALVFLSKAGEANVVAGMAQGHYPLIEKDGVVRLKSSPDTGNLVEKRGPRESARSKLIGKKLTEATDSVKAAAKALKK
jgi:hypothetical protein